MSQKVLIGCVGFVAGTLVAASASALPILQIILDTEEVFSARVSDGAVLPGNNHFPPLIGGRKWVANVSVRTLGDTPEDLFDVLGTVEHSIPPHGEGPGPQFAFLMRFSTLGATNRTYGFGETGEVPLPHEAHLDIYRAFGEVEVFGGRIVSWHVNIWAYHFTPAAPTPGTAMLGALGVLCAARRQRG